MSRLRVADVAMDPRTGGSEALFTYRLNVEAAVGDAVYVPLGTRQTLGFVTDVYEASEEDLGFPFTSLKSVFGVVEGLSLPEGVVLLARHVAEQTLCPLPVALAPATPPGVRERLATVWSTTREPTEKDLLSPLQIETLRVLNDSGGSITDSKGKRVPASSLRVLRLLRNKGLVRQTLKVQPIQERRDAEPMLRLTPDASRVEAFLVREGRRKPAQALTLMTLQGADRALLTSLELRALAGVTEVTVRALTEAGLLQKVDPMEKTSSVAPSPNSGQAVAIDAVTDAIRTHETRAFLLFGVTGSGKTEVYLRSAAEALRAGRQVLYLVPEIALAAQAIAQLRDRFGHTVAVMHSDLPAAERLRNWMRIRDGRASVVVGARSALFAPVSRLGLVIVDEEHEAAYKQESAPRYHAKGVARFLAEYHRCPLVLGSATPSVESFAEAEATEGSTGNEQPLVLLSLPRRAASAQMPSVFVSDLAEGYRSGRPAILSENLRAAMEEAISKKEQVILFLNRRAYAPFIICRDCGHQMTCPNCAISLSWHRRDGRLRCHHCGFQVVPPENCPNCAGNRLNPFGVGTEKVHEVVVNEFPGVTVSRLDRDVVRRKGALEETLAAFRSGDVSVLVGTQMVAKGLDFPKVTVVGVIAADISLNIPDFRSSERTFQLLAQVGGRSGRGDLPGKVFIQTFNPTHPSVVAAQAHDYLGMYEALKLERAEAGYPPFRRLVNVLLTSEDRPLLLETAASVAELVKAELPEGATLLGPVDCAVERIQNRWRRHMLVKLLPNQSPKPIGAALVGFSNKAVQMTIDVDPYTLM